MKIKIGNVLGTHLDSHRFYQKLSYLVLLMVGLFILLTFKQYGISNDEEVQHTYGQLLLNFYNSGFVDQAAFHYKNLYLYGGFFDLLAASIEKIKPFLAISSISPNLWLWEMRHLLSASFGLAGLLAVYKIAKTLANPRAGFIALFLLTLTGAWSGAMFTHTKDIPFATCMTWALYYTVQLSQSLPSISRAHSIKLGIAIGCALGMRIGGGFSVVYLLLTLGFSSLMLSGNINKKVHYLGNAMLNLWPAALCAFLLMAFFWPWGVISPSHPVEAIKAFSNFSFNMQTIDNGVVSNIGDIPRTYLLSYLLVRLPEVFLFGLLSVFVLSVIKFQMLIQHLKSKKSVAIASLLISICFPLLFVFMTKPTLYNGVRHFTFLLPPLAILAALGVDWFLQLLTQFKKVKMLYLLLGIGLSLLTVVKLVRLHPYEYVDYNVLAGSTFLAEQQWEGDYWSSSLREAANTLNNMPLPKLEKPYLVAVCAEAIQASAYLDDRFKVTDNWISADFFMSSTNMHCDQVLQGQVIGVVKRLDTTLAVVKDRRQLDGDDRIPQPAPRYHF